MELPAFTGVPSPLTMPITPVEVQRAISKLNSGRAYGHDDLPADLLKSTADLIAPSIATILNDALEHHEPLDIGKGVPILLQKPGKPVGPLTSVRPIVLLSALRKTLTHFTKALATKAWRRHEQQWLTSSGNGRGRCWKPPSMLSLAVLNICRGRHSIACEGLHVVSTIPLPSG